MISGKVRDLIRGVRCGKWGGERIYVFTKPGWTAEVRRKPAPEEEPDGAQFLTFCCVFRNNT